MKWSDHMERTCFVIRSAPQTDELKGNRRHVRDVTTVPVPWVPASGNSEWRAGTPCRVSTACGRALIGTDIQQDGWINPTFKRNHFLVMRLVAHSATRKQNVEVSNEKKETAQLS
jgi:hypothetical protein